MTELEALTQALALAITAPENRLQDAVNLAEGLAQHCTAAEVEQAKEDAHLLTLDLPLIH
jgi:hypothetical protein